VSARRVFDVDAIMRDVRIAANLRPAAKTATLRQNHPNCSNVADVAIRHAAEIEERAALAADRVPAVYLDAWARLQCQRPFSVDPDAWSRAIEGGGLFLDAWGADAAKMGWSAGELFDVPSHGRRAGLVWQLKGEQVEALGDDHIRLSDGRMIESQQFKAERK
jgi:hypothetical protein